MAADADAAEPLNGVKGLRVESDTANEKRLPSQAALLGNGQAHTHDDAP